MTRIQSVVSRFAASQVAPWAARRPKLDKALAEYRRLSDLFGSFFLFEFAHGAVRVLPKPQYSAAQMTDLTNGHIWRASAYRSFFATVARVHAPTLSGILPMSMDDMGPSAVDYPLVAFQRRIGGLAMLVPDIDAISHDFHSGQNDGLAYEDKQDRAIFVGSTTGFMPSTHGLHTLRSVAALESPRLRSAVFFRGSQDVDFRLATICQCDEPATEQAIRDLGFGVGATDWPEQLRSRLLISMDGNGATCSRVAIALKSNSALLKYASPFELYYFQGLVPYRHYLPIRTDADVTAIVRAERKRPGLYKAVAENGTRFFNDLLTMDPAMAYTAQVLAGFFDCFDRDCPVQMAAGPPAALPPTGLIAELHVSNIGDVQRDTSEFAGETGDQHAIEGFSVQPPAELGTGGLEYRAFSAAEDSGWQQAGRFVGSRGVSQPLTGFAFRIGGAARHTHQCRYSGWFADGARSGPLDDGAPCQSASGQALQAIRVQIVPRPGG